MTVSTSIRPVTANGAFPRPFARFERTILVFEFNCVVNRSMRHILQGPWKLVLGGESQNGW